MYFKAVKRTAVEKDPLSDGNAYQEFTPIKKGAGRIKHSPRMDSRFAMSDVLLWLPTTTIAYADRTLRPFARRRARTLRPLEVAILLRKP